MCYSLLNNSHWKIWLLTLKRLHKKYTFWGVCELMCSEVSFQSLTYLSTHDLYFETCRELFVQCCLVISDQFVLVIFVRIRTRSGLSMAVFNRLMSLLVMCVQCSHHLFHPSMSWTEPSIYPCELDSSKLTILLMCTIRSMFGIHAMHTCVQCSHHLEAARVQMTAHPSAS